MRLHPATPRLGKNQRMMLIRWLPHLPATVEDLRTITLRADKTKMSFRWILSWLKNLERKQVLECVMCEDGHFRFVPTPLVDLLKEQELIP